MRLLTGSLILVTLSAAIGLGWLIDYVYQTEKPVIETYEHRQLILLSHQYADLLVSQPALLTELSSSDVQVTISYLADFPLPPLLLKTFISGEPLILKTSDTVSLNIYQPKSKQVVTFTFLAPPVIQSLADNRLILTVIFYLGIVTFILVWLLPLIKRLSVINKSLVNFGQGDLSQRIQNSNFSYIHNIEHGFNDMAQRINTLIADNKLLSRAVSHDLRTPIARLRFGIDLLQETNIDETQKAHLDHLDKDLDAMESLVETLLNYAKLEQAKITLTKKKIVLNSLIKDIISPYQYQHNIVFTPTDTQITAIIDTHYFSMLMNNILSNAARYARHKVIVSLSKIQQQIVITIEDDGVGIPTNEFDKVLMPFYRTEQPSNATYQGHGMGLAIVARIAEWHRIDVQLSRSKVLGGLAIKLTFIA
jgi:two-component system OmpR family sensor kinase